MRHKHVSQPSPTPALDIHTTFRLHVHGWSIHTIQLYATLSQYVRYSGMYVVWNIHEYRKLVIYSEIYLLHAS
jgi:hypothetical protein